MSSLPVEFLLWQLLQVGALSLSAFLVFLALLALVRWACHAPDGYAIRYDSRY